MSNNIILYEHLNRTPNQKAIGNDLFESHTIISLEAEHGVDTWIHSKVQNNVLCLAIKKGLWVINVDQKVLLEDERKFEHYIDTFDLADGYLLIGCSNAELFLLDWRSKEIIGKCLVTALANVAFVDKFFIGIYQECDNNNSGLSFLVLTKDGEIHRVLVDLNREQPLQISLIISLGHHITCASYYNSKLLAIGHKIFIYDAIENLLSDGVFTEGCTMKQVWPLNKLSFIAQKKDNTLCKICAITLISYDLNLKPIIDFNYHIHKKNAYMYFLQDDPKSGQQKLQFSSSNGDDVFVISSSNIIHLVNNEDDDMNQLYITREQSTLEVNVVQETKPEDRLQRLIRKLQFEEAEAFALQYGLNTLDICKAKLRMYVEKEVCTDEDIGEMLPLMEKLNDVRFNVECCLNAACSSIECFEKLVNYASTLNIHSQADCANTAAKFSKTLLRFDTYKLLARCSGEVVDIAKWNWFLGCDLFDYLISSLRKQNLEASIVLFTKLDLEHFTEEKISCVLKFLDNLGVNVYVAFLSPMIPKTLLHLPSAFSLCVERICNKILTLEGRKRESNFPECAIDFLTKVVGILESNQNLLENDEIDVKKEMDKLYRMKKCLDTILEVKNNYNIYLPLAKCLQGPGAILRILLDVNIDDIEKFLKEFLIQFMISNGFNADQIFNEEIERMLESYDEKYWGNLIPPIWRCISSMEMQLHLLQAILKTASKPWRDDIRHILNVALGFKHPLVANIEMEARSEPIYILLYKYNLKNETMNSIWSDMFVIKRIIHCNDPNLVGDVYTFCTTDERRCDANTLMLQHFLHSNQVSQALKLIGSHSPQEVSRYAFPLLVYCEAFIPKYPEFRSNVMKTLSTLSAKMAQLPITNRVFKTYVNTFKIFDILPSSFQNKQTLRDLSNLRKRPNILDLLIRELARQFDEDEDFNALLLQINRYALAFDVPHEQVLLQLCRVSGDFMLLYNCAQVMHDNGTDVKSMCCMTTLILKLVGSDVDQLNATFNTTVDDINNKPVDEMLLKNCLLIARKIVAKVWVASEGEMSVCNVFNWATTTTHLLETKQEQCKVTMNAIRSIFDMYTAYLSATSLKSASEYITFKASLSDDEYNYIQDKEIFCKAIDHRLEFLMPSIFRENNAWTCIRLITAVQNSLLWRGDGDTARGLNRYMNACKNYLVPKIFAAKEIDIDLACTVLMTFDSKKARKIINDALVMYKANISKFEAIVKLAMKHAKFTTSGDDYSTLRLGIKWWKTIKNCTIPYKEFCLKLSRGELLTPLIHQNQINLEQITAFCADFKLDTQTYYLKYLKNLIATWKPVYEVEIDAIGNRILKMKNTEKETLIELCLRVVNVITDRDSVLKCINALWNKSNIYYYEIYGAMLTIIARGLNESRYVNYKIALHFLQQYTRTSKPTEVELSEWFGRFMGNEPIDPLSEWRFPFSPLLFTSDVWKILRPEINLFTYEKWFKLVNVLDHLQVNEICSYAIKDVTFTVAPQRGGNNEEYNLHPKYDGIFAEIDKCIGCIDQPLVAASVALSLLAKMPDGIDKVTAAKLAFKYAMKNKESGASEGDTTYKNIHKMYYRCLSKHILHANNLATPQYVALLQQPVELINALYSDERILQTVNSSFNQCPNINKAVNELGELFQINIKEMRISLLKSWLCDENTFSANLDQSVYLAPEVDGTTDDTEAGILRIAYMCSGADVENWRTYLYELVQTKINQFLLQAKILKALYIITPAAEVAKLCECSSKELLITIKKFFLMHDLQSLGVRIDMERLEGIPKSRLLRKFSKHISNTLYLKVMISICHIYHVYDLDIWEIIMLELIKQNMISNLKACINLFQRQGLNVQNAFYVKAWQTVVDHAFKTIDEEKTDINKRIAEYIYFIQGSPVLNQLNLLKVQSICIKLGKFSFAALLLQHIPIETRMERLHAIIGHIQKDNLLMAVRNLKDLGFIGLQFVSEIIESAK